MNSCISTLYFLTLQKRLSGRLSDTVTNIKASSYMVGRTMKCLTARMFLSRQKNYEMFDCQDVFIQTGLMAAD